jgi:hypothetical protein
MRFGEMTFDEVAAICNKCDNIKTQQCPFKDIDSVASICITNKGKREADLNTIVEVEKKC